VQSPRTTIAKSEIVDQHGFALLRFRQIALVWDELQFTPSWLKKLEPGIAFLPPRVTGETLEARSSRNFPRQVLSTLVQEGSKMQNRTAAILASLMLSAGLLLAQEAPTDQQQPANQPSGQSAPMQQHRGAREGMMQASWLAQKLNLSEDQVAQLKPILAAQRQQMQALRADTSQTIQDLQTKAQAIRQETNSKIEALLNDSQKQQYEQMLAARRALRQQHTNGQQPANQPGM